MQCIIFRCVSIFSFYLIFLSYAHADDSDLNPCQGKADRNAIKSIIRLKESFIEKEGHKITVLPHKKTDVLHIGVIASTKYDLNITRKALSQAKQWFYENNVSAVIVNGDIGINDSSLLGIFDVLGKWKIPVFVIMGNNESTKSFHRAFAIKSRMYPNLFNLDVIRHVVFEQAQFFSLPGYYNPQLLHAEDGCVYEDEDIEEFENIIQLSDSNIPSVIVSHGPPQGYHPQAIDYVPEVGNVGDRQINTLITKFQFPFGIFAHISEAGGKATDLNGLIIHEENKELSSFYLNAGSIQPFPMLLNDGSTSTGLATVVSFSKKKTAQFVFKRF